MVKNGDVCLVEVVDSMSNQTSLYFNFCNGNSISIIISKDQIHITDTDGEYNYVMEDERAYYDTNVVVDTISYNNFNYVKASIRARKKGLSETTVDDIEIMGKSRTSSIVRKTGSIAEYYADGDPHYFNVAHSPGNYKVEVWAPESMITDRVTRKGYYAVGTVNLAEGQRLVINPGLPVALWNYCAGEEQTCSFSGTKTVAYLGNSTVGKYLTATDSILCSNTIFGDPSPGVRKSCYIETEEYIPSIVSVTSSTALIPSPSELELVISAGADGADISNPNLTNAHMTCLNCEASGEEDPYVIETTTCSNTDPQVDCAKIGSGFVRVTKVS